jgi:hypothetical protein
MPTIGAVASYADPEYQPCLKSKTGNRVLTTNSILTIPVAMPIAIGDLIVIRAVFDTANDVEPDFDPLNGGNINVNSQYVGNNWRQRFQGATVTAGTGIVGVLGWLRADRVSNRGATIAIQGTQSRACAAYVENFGPGWNVTTTQGPNSTSGVGISCSASAQAALGDLVVGMCAYEGYSTFTGDSDTFAGAWSTPILYSNAVTGTDDTRLTIAGQHKQHVGSLGTQTYNCSWLTSTDWVGMCASFLPYV